MPSPDIDDLVHRSGGVSAAIRTHFGLCLNTEAEKRTIDNFV